LRIIAADTAQEEAKSALVHNNKPLKSRIISVAIAEDRTKTTQVVRHGGAHSASPAPEDASSAHRPSIALSPKSTTEPEVPSKSTDNNNNNNWTSETARTRQERTIALLNLSDTVNEARVEAFFKTYGAIKKIVMQPYRNGAIIEFEDVNAAGKVGMGVDCSALGEGTKVGSVADLTSKGSAKSSAGKMRPAQAGVSRPTQKGGRRGGLGFKRGGGIGSTGDRNETDGEKKSNADFRAMFVKSGEGGETKEGEDKEGESKE